MVFGDPDQWADVMRWWSVLGALLGITPLTRHLKSIAVRYQFNKAGFETMPIRLALSRTAGLLFFLLFVIGAGAVIPLTNRVVEFSLYDLTFRVFMAGAWTCVGLGSWLVAIGYARSRFLIMATAITWFVAMSFAIVATA